MGGHIIGLGTIYSKLPPPKDAAFFRSKNTDLHPNGGESYMKNPGYRDFFFFWKKIPGAGIFLFLFLEENPGYRNFFFFWKKILGTGIYRKNFSGATRPIKTLSCILMGGGADGILGGEFAVYFFEVLSYKRSLFGWLTRPSCLSYGRGVCCIFSSQRNFLIHVLTKLHTCLF